MTIVNHGGFVCVENQGWMNISGGGHSSGEVGRQVLSRVLTLNPHFCFGLRFDIIDVQLLQCSLPAIHGRGADGDSVTGLRPSPGRFLGILHQKAVHILIETRAPLQLILIRNSCCEFTGS